MMLLTTRLSHRGLGSDLTCARPHLQLIDDQVRDPFGVIVAQSQEQAA